MRWIWLMCFGFVGCGSEPLAQPFLAQAIPKKEVGKVQNVAEKTVRVKKPTEAVEAVKPKVVTNSKAKAKALAGKVTFEGLSAEELSSFRVIPESGTQLFVPKNRVYEQVDGFWWEGSESGKWLKIPDSSEAWVGKAPEKFDGIAQEKNLTVYYRSNALVKFAGFLRNGVGHPDWVGNVGATRSPVPSPWSLR